MKRVLDRQQQRRWCCRLRLLIHRRRRGTRRGEETTRNKTPRAVESQQQSLEDLLFRFRRLLPLGLSESIRARHARSPRTFYLTKFQNVYKNYQILLHPDVVGFFSKTFLSESLQCRVLQADTGGARVGEARRGEARPGGSPVAFFDIRPISHLPA